MINVRNRFSVRWEPLCLNMNKSLLVSMKEKNPKELDRYWVLLDNCNRTICIFTDYKFVAKMVGVSSNHLYKVIERNKNSFNDMNLTPIERSYKTITLETPLGRWYLTTNIYNYTMLQINGLYEFDEPIVFSKEPIEV